MPEPRPASENRLPAFVMTALSVVYPLVTLRYFWEDWFRYFKLKAPMLVEASGFVIQTTDGRLTLLSPWRLLDAGVSAVLLWSAARRLRQGAPGARAFSLIALLGVLLPQVLWYGELSLDWFRARHFFSLTLGGLAAVLLPSLLLAAKGKATENWGKLKEEGPRVMKAAVGLGWLSFASMAFLEHLNYFIHPLQVGGMALLTLIAAVTGMVGLYRQRAWGVLAAASSVGSLAGLTALLTNEHFMPRWSLMSVFVEAIAGTPLRAAGTVAFSSLALVALLGPFLRGFWRKAMGTEPMNTEPAYAAESFASSAGLRVAMPAASGLRVTSESPATEDEDLLSATELRQEESPRRAR